MIFFSYFISAKGLSESLRIFWISQVFPANKDRNTVVEHLLLSPFDARLIRFHPKTYRGYTSMRAEVYGCRKGGCWKFLKLVGSRFRRFSWPKKTTDVLLIVLLLQIELRESIKTSNKSYDSWHPCNVLRHVAGTKYPPNWCCTIIKVSVHTKGHAATTHYWDTYTHHFCVWNVVSLSLLHVPATRPCNMLPERVLHKFCRCKMFLQLDPLCFPTLRLHSQTFDLVP